MSADLKFLLKNLKPLLNEGDYVFCTVKDTDPVALSRILFSFKEAEGLTLVLRKSEADRMKLSYDRTWAWITLTVVSSLEMVGLTAAISKALSAEKISCNVVAAYYHDHIFVKTEEAARAVGVLASLSQ